MNRTLAQLGTLQSSKKIDSTYPTVIRSRTGALGMTNHRGRLFDIHII